MKHSMEKFKFKAQFASYLVLKYMRIATVKSFADVVAICQIVSVFYGRLCLIRLAKVRLLPPNQCVWLP